MGKGTVENELKKVVYLSMIMTMTILAILIIALNRIMNWEIWMLPLIILGTAICWGIYLANHLPQRSQIYICGIVSMLFVFYYCVKIQTVFDCGTVIVIMLFLFTFTRERILTIAGAICAFLSLIFHLIVEKSIHPLDLDLYSVVRAAMVFLIVPFSAIIIDHIVKAWTNAEHKYLSQIKSLTDENERVNNFLANVSHEVRTPISAVIGLSHVLQNENLSEQTMSKIKAISIAGHRVSEQINDILDFTEIDMGKIAITNDTYMVSSMINDLLPQLAYSDNYGLDLVIDIDPKIPAVLVGDETKIKRIIWHLIRNGFKYTKEGGVCLNITADKRPYGVNLIIVVKDTGVGINKNEMDSIYEKFYQVDSGRARTSGGLGLGIPIINGLTNAMGGVFTIESQIGEGTVVKVSIPQKVVDSKPGISVSDHENCVAAGFISFMTTTQPKIRDFYLEMIGRLSNSLDIKFFRVQSIDELQKLILNNKITHLFAGTGEYLANRDYLDGLARKMNVAILADQGFDETVAHGITLLQKPFYGTQIANFLNHQFSNEIPEDLVVTFPGVKALVVDDEHMNLVVAKEIFESYGMIISTASGGEEAIKMCDQNDYDIVFMDHMMPGMDGVEAMHIIKQNAGKANKPILVVALTANAISTAREMFISEGFDGFIPKPIEVTELERVLKKVLPNNFISYSEKKAIISKDTVSEKKTLDSTKEDKTDIIEVLKGLDVDTEYGLDYCSGDKDFYLELLADYADKSDSKLKEIQDYFNNKDYKNYEIRVHGVKSTSKLIGAMSLSEKAKQLEDAAKEKNEAFITDYHDIFIKDYEALMNTIKSHLSPGEEGGSLC
ncbi:hybrid sensor histidine kinase/response regulator [Butyrivibrio sp. AE2032]|uniref:hybrid sensor histidine kinase/response regulator n=1 Tax=Butyrivibrio sp. AE2032 TaxID=1458463 RepID=UPI0009E02705|nr:hybrid sensor histidine kinase/response regulator [Butyrivibrio sp. AE2032]